MSEWHLIVYVALAELLLHYLPWHKFLAGRALPRPVAYALGVCGFALPLSAWLYERGQTQIIITLWLAIVAAGLAVLVGYGADAVIDLYWDKREADEELEMRRGQD